MTQQAAALDDLDERSREIFRRVVEMYLKDGDPVGSRTLSKALDDPLSPASIRNVMQDLELAGLIAAPHVSAGRIPTSTGLRLFLDGFLQIGEINPEEKASIESALTDSNVGVQRVLDEASTALSGLSRCASLVIAPKRDAPIKHIEVAPLSDGRALAVIATADGAVENRLLQTPVGLTPSAIAEATNFLNAHMRGSTLSEARRAVSEGISKSRADLDAAAQALIEAGFAEWSGPSDSDDARLIVRGLSNLIAENTAVDELESVRVLFDELERKRDLAQVLELAEGGEGVRVFIGAESKLFSHSGSALVISPYMDSDQNIIGALGVIGPTRLNYSRILPIVDFTARMVGQLVGRAGASSAGTTRQN
jgi:heat-inducible transcriptional repressor